MSVNVPPRSIQNCQRAGVSGSFIGGSAPAAPDSAKAKAYRSGAHYSGDGACDLQAFSQEPADRAHGDGVPHRGEV